MLSRRNRDDLHRQIEPRPHATAAGEGGRYPESGKRIKDRTFHGLRMPSRRSRPRRPLSEAIAREVQNHLQSLHIGHRIALTVNRP